MINPTDFLKTAEFLKEQQEEWHIRTTVNRSYYGAFLYFRDFLTCQGVSVPNHKIKSQHQFVIECFEKSKTAAHQRSKSSRKNSNAKNKMDHQMLGKIWWQLRTLFQDRRFADYRLDMRFQPSCSGDSLKRAKTTIDDFDSLRGSPTETLVINIAKYYAQDLIRSDR